MGSMHSKNAGVSRAPVSRQHRTFWEELIIQAIAVGGLMFSLRVAMKYLDPYREQREQAKQRSAFLTKVLGRKLDLNEFEQLLAMNVINPNDIDVELSHISGLDELIHELELKVLIPMLQPDMYSTTLFKPARGVLLYGPPGTGKTMLAKALARHSGCYFLNITTSSIMSKWLGDANRLVRAIFSLAQKLQPCIIFIDEVDALLGKRGGSSEHEASLQVKTEFMQLWDGMESTKGQRIVVMGATNRPGMVDDACLRRFSVQHEVGLPDVSQRKSIIGSYLERHVKETGKDAVHPELLEEGGLSWIAKNTDGYSGSDLMELCSQAAQRGLGEYWEAVRSQSRVVRNSLRQDEAPTASIGGVSGLGNTGHHHDSNSSTLVKLRAVNLDDFKAAMKHVTPSTTKADEFTQRSSMSGMTIDPSMLLQFLSRMAAAGNGSSEE